jgi:hypothetical protein
VQRRGRILDGLDDVELVRTGIEDVAVAQDLDEAERKDDRAIRPLLVDHPARGMIAATGISERNLPRVEGPVLSKDIPAPAYRHDE